LLSIEKVDVGGALYTRHATTTDLPIKAPPEALRLAISLVHQPAADDASANATSADSGMPTLEVKSSRAVKLVKLVRLARMLKILRLLRLLKAFKVVKNAVKPDSLVMQLRDRIVMWTIQHTRKMRIIKLLALTMMVLHLLTCILGMSAIFADERLESWWGTHGYCWPDELYQLAPGEAFRARCVDPWTMYTVCYHISLGVAFKLPWGPIVLTGPGEPYHSDPETNAMFRPTERAFFVVVNFLCAILGLYLSGSFVAVIVGRDLTVAEHITRFCSKYRISYKQHRELQMYFMSLDQLGDLIPKPDLFFKLSPVLATKLVLEMHAVWLQKLAFASELRRDVSVFTNGPRRSLAYFDAVDRLLCRLALTMKSALFIAKEHPQPGRLYVIIGGAAIDICRQSALLREGDSWGAVACVLGNDNYGTGCVKALTTLQVIYTDHRTLKAIPEQFPELKPAYMKMRIWAIQKYLCAAVRRGAAIKRLLATDADTAHKLINNHKQLKGLVSDNQPPDPLAAPAADVAPVLSAETAELRARVDTLQSGVDALLKHFALSVQSNRSAHHSARSAAGGAPEEAGGPSAEDRFTA